jgi:RimJ/RimL family protein N-acetyltransferase
MITFKPISKDNLQLILDERHKVSETLRTNKMLTMDEQLAWYEKEIANRDSRTRYWEMWDGEYVDNCIGWNFIGYGGIENIQWENSTGEISLLIFEKYRGKGLGRACVKTILDQAFNSLNLHSVYGECYKCGNWQFWEKVLHLSNMLNDLNAVVETFDLPNRKYWDGKYYGSYYFNVERLGK